MQYIYDVVLSYNNNFYEYYFWEQDLIQFNKVLVLKVDNQLLYDVLNYEIKINNTLLLKLKKNSKCKLSKLPFFPIIIGNKSLVVGLAVGPNGFIKKISSLLPEEEVEVKNIIMSQNRFVFDYKKLNKRRKVFLTNNEIVKVNNLLKVVNAIYYHNQDALKYLLLEIYNKELNNQEGYRLICQDINDYKFNIVLKLTKVLDKIKKYI